MSLDGIASRLVLVYPPEMIQDGRCYCRFEPDGIALLKGFLKGEGYDLVDLVFSSQDPTPIEEKNGKKYSGWGIAPFDKEGISFRHVVRSALNLSLESSTALSLMKLLPLATLPDTDIIGFSIGFPSQLYHSLVLARLVKQLNPKIFVVLGGPLITSHITFVAKLQELTSVVDGIIPGYGEEPLAQLILCLEEKGELNQVPNLYLPATEGFLRNLAVWQPDKTNLLTVPDYGRGSLQRKFDPYFPLRPSIGCYWGKCAFCVYPSMPNGKRTQRQYIVLKPEELVEYIKVLMESGSGNRFELCSDALPPRYLKNFSEQVLQSKLDIKWSAWSCVDKGFTDDVLDTMKRSGCESILLGMESANRRVLERINKMHTRQDIDRVLNAFFSAGVGLFLTLCIGFPGETHEEAMETIKYLRDLMARRPTASAMEVRLYRFALMCNTPVLENFDEYGIVSIDLSDIYHIDDDFGYHYKVTEGMGFDEVRNFAFKWRANLGIATDDSPFVFAC